MKRPLIYNVVVCYSVVGSYLDEHYHRKREGRAMPKFGQLFAQLLDLEEYEKNNTTIRDNKIYLEFCKMFTNCIVPRSEWREWAYKTNYCVYVSASDEAYMIWAYINYSDWWLKKHRHDKHKDLMNSRIQDSDNDENARKRSRKHYYYTAVEEDCSDMADPNSVGTPKWTSGGKTIQEVSTARGNGITLEGIAIFNKIHGIITKERENSDEFDRSFLAVMQGNGGGKVAKKKSTKTAIDDAGFDKEHDYMEEYIMKTYGTKSVGHGTFQPRMAVSVPGEVTQKASI